MKISCKTDIYRVCLNMLPAALALYCLVVLVGPFFSGPVDDDPERLLVQAETLERSGQNHEARFVYDALLHHPLPGIRAEAHYKLGTLYLEEVAPVWHAMGVLEYARVSTGIALAREHLGAALRLKPDHWEARYNLEYAERITPPPREQEKARWHGNKSSVFATLPSLPGGAP